MYLPTPTQITTVTEYGNIVRFGDYSDHNGSVAPYVLTIFRADGSWRHSFLVLTDGSNVPLWDSYSSNN